DRVDGGDTRLHRALDVRERGLEGGGGGDSGDADAGDRSGQDSGRGRHVVHGVAGARQAAGPLVELASVDGEGGGVGLEGALDAAQTLVKRNEGVVEPFLLGA